MVNRKYNSKYLISCHEAIVRGELCLELFPTPLVIAIVTLHLQFYWFTGPGVTSHPHTVHCLCCTAHMQPWLQIDRLQHLRPR